MLYIVSAMMNSNILANSECNHLYLAGKLAIRFGVNEDGIKCGTSVVRISELASNIRSNRSWLRKFPRRIHEK